MGGSDGESDDGSDGESDRESDGESNDGGSDGGSDVGGDGGSDGVLHSCFLSKNLELMMLVMLNTVMMMIVHLTMWDGGRRGLSAVQATAKHWQIGKKLSETTPHYFLGITVYSVYSVYYTQPLRTEGDQGQTLSWRQGSDLNTQYLS